MPKKIAVFATVLLAFAGANVFQVWSMLATFLFTSQLPTTPGFTIVFWLWFVTAVAAAWCGLQGGYTLLRKGSVDGSALTFFVVAGCVVFKVGGHELGFASVRFALNFGSEGFSLGVNVLGFALVAWLASLRKEQARPLRSVDEAVRGRGAV